MPITVAVAGAGSLLGQGIIKALRRASVPMRVVALDYFAQAVGLYWADAAYLLPDVLSPAVHEDVYVDRLVDVLRRERVEVLLLGTDFEVARLAARRKEVEGRTGCRVVVSAPDVVEIADDKWATYEFLRAHGFGCPPSLVALERLDDFVAEHGFPLLVKPRRGARSRGVSLVSEHARLAAALAAAGPDPIVQKAIGTPESEYTCGAVVLDGECMGVIVMRRDLRDGNTYRAYVEPVPELEALARRVALALRPDGPVNVQLRMGRSGPAIFEINARFSGTTIMRTLAGFNEVEAVVRWAVSGERIPLAVQRPGVVLRHWEEMFVSWDAYRAMAAGDLA